MTTNIVSWLENATPEQVEFIERMGPENIINMKEELDELRSKNRGEKLKLFRMFLEDHKQSIGFISESVIVVLLFVIIISTLHYAITGASREYKYSLKTTLECRINASGKGRDLDSICGKLPKSPYYKETESPLQTVIRCREDAAGNNKSPDEVCGKMPEGIYSPES